MSVVLWFVILAVLATTVWYAVGRHSTPGATVPTPKTATTFPVGVASSTELSGDSPPGPGALPGYSLEYVTDFSGNSIPPSWYVFTGVSGDRGGKFAASHVRVKGGVLQLATSIDPHYKNHVVTGGICQCGQPRTYGAFFVRSKFEGAGPNDSELLWPKVGWPPEIDFNENGGSVVGTSSTVHFGSTNRMQQNFVSVNMQEWHTWGVIWTAKSITFVLDGRVWAKVTGRGEVPHQPMTLDFQQHALCGSGSECPRSPAYLLVDWVAEYSSNH